MVAILKKRQSTWALSYRGKNNPVFNLYFDKVLFFSSRSLSVSSVVCSDVKQPVKVSESEIQTVEVHGRVSNVLLCMYTCCNNLEVIFKCLTIFHLIQIQHNMTTGTVGYISDSSNTDQVSHTYTNVYICCIMQGSI